MSPAITLGQHRPLLLDFPSAAHQHLLKHTAPTVQPYLAPPAFLPRPITWVVADHQPTLFSTCSITPHPDFSLAGARHHYHRWVK